MTEKVMVDFPGFITRDKVTRHLLVHNNSHVLISNTTVAEMYLRLFIALGHEETGKIIYQSAKTGAYQVQKTLIASYKVTLRSQEDFINRVLKLPFYVQTYGLGTGHAVRRVEEFLFIVRNSSIGESLKGSGLQRPVCYFLAGFFAGITQAYAELLSPLLVYDCVETRCIAIGDTHCEFKLFPREAGSVQYESPS